MEKAAFNRQRVREIHPRTVLGWGCGSVPSVSLEKPVMRLPHRSQDSQEQVSGNRGGPYWLSIERSTL